MSVILYFLLSPERHQSLGDKAHSIKCFFNFLIDCVVMKALSFWLLNFLLAFEIDNLKSASIFSSNGFRLICSLEK